MASEFFEVKSTSNKSSISKASNKESKTSNKESKVSNKVNKLSNLKDKKQLSNDNNGFVEIKINNKNESRTTIKPNKQNSQTFNYLNKDIKQEGSKTLNKTTKLVDMSLKRKRTALDTNIKSENSKSKSKNNKLFNDTNAKTKIAITGSSPSPNRSQGNVVTTAASSDKLIETMSRS